MTDYPTDPAAYPLPILYGDIIVGMRVRGTFTAPGGGAFTATATIQSIEESWLATGDSFWIIQSPDAWRRQVPGGTTDYQLVAPPPDPLSQPAVGSIVTASGVAYQRVGDPRNDRWVKVGTDSEYTLASLGSYTLVYTAPEPTEESP